MPTLEWIGKDKVINHHLDVPYRVLEEKYTFNKESTSENKIIHGDNLVALKSLLPEYEGKIKCIYIDPPYNTGEEKWVYNDNVNDPKIKKWLGEVVGKEGEDLSRHDKWLCMMYPRLKLLHQLLAEDSIIFISIDDNELANLKQICDEIFGIQHFVATIPWRKRTAKSDVPYGISQDCESILCYVKGSSFKGGEYKESRKYYETPDYPNRPWRHHDLTTQRTSAERPHSFFTMINPKNGAEYPANPIRTWAVTKETFPEYYAQGRIIFPGDYDFLNISNPVFRYWKEDDIKKAGETFGFTSTSTYLPSDIGMTKDGTQEITDIFGEKKFNFPKPSSLIQYLLNIATVNTPDALILDSFAGTGTTAHAVLNLNKADGGNRKFILIEMEDYAEKTTAERVRRVINGYVSKKPHKIILYDKKITVKNIGHGLSFVEKANEIYMHAKENGENVSKPKITDSRLQVIKTAEKNEMVEGTGGDFTYYELGDVVLHQDKTLNENLPIEKIQEYIWITETHTSYRKQDEPYYLGTANSTAYYFCYEKGKSTTLDYELLSQIRVKEDSYVIYADTCILSEEELLKYNITFKKIPRDITTL